MVQKWQAKPKNIRNCGAQRNREGSFRLAISSLPQEILFVFVYWDSEKPMNDTPCTEAR